VRYVVQLDGDAQPPATQRAVHRGFLGGLGGIFGPSALLNFLTSLTSEDDCAHRPYVRLCREPRQLELSLSQRQGTSLASIPGLRSGAKRESWGQVVIGRPAGVANKIWELTRVLVARVGATCAGCVHPDISAGVRLL